MSAPMSAEMRRAMDEVLDDFKGLLLAKGADQVVAVMLPLVDKYARLAFLRDELPHALMALQYHTTMPKAKEALTAALRILAQAKGMELPS